jgi:putative ABC transport system permease protein
MGKKPLTTVYISVRNLKSKPFRTISLILLVSLFAFVLFGGAILSMSLENGMGNLSDRMGADILAVPYGYEASIQSALLRGEPSTFYFDADITEKVAGVEGVESISPQLYIATLNSGCCAYPIQLIGFDPQTDFVIQPWMSGALRVPLSDGEIVVGGSINANIGQMLKFYDQELMIAARLEKTGVGSDTSVFMNLSTARRIAREAERLKSHPAAGNGKLISSAAIRIRDGYDVKAVANSILQSYAKEGVRVVVSKNMLSDVSGSLRGLMAYVYTLGGVLWALAAGALAIVFSVSVKSRKREFGIYRALGSPRSKLAGLILCESSIISVFGAVAGIAAAALVVFPFSAYIGTLLALPYLSPSIGAALAAAATAALVSSATGPLASAYCAVRIGRSDIYDAMNGDEG